MAWGAGAGREVGTEGRERRPALPGAFSYCAWTSVAYGGPGTCRRGARESGCSEREAGGLRAAWREDAAPGLTSQGCQERAHHGCGSVRI